MRMTEQEFDKLVQEALEELPAYINDAMENVAVLVKEWPTAQDLDDSEMEGHQIFGLYSGVPLSERGIGLPLLPDIITLFKGPLEQAFASREQVVHEIRVTVMHEVGHHLGMTEYDLERLGYG